MRIGSLFVGDDLSRCFLALWGYRASNSVRTCWLLIEESTIEIKIARIFLLYFLVEKIDQILIFLAIVLSDRRLSLLSLLSRLLWSVSLLLHRSTLFAVNINWIFSWLFGVIIARSWVVLFFYSCLAIAPEIWNVKLLLNFVFYRTFHIFFFVFVVYSFSACICELLQVAWIFHDGLIQIFLCGTSTLDSWTFFVLVAVLFAERKGGFAWALL